MTCTCYGPRELLGAGHMAQQRALYAESRLKCEDHAPVYDEDGIQVWCADARDVLPLLDAVDHVITDPPYGEHVHGRQWVGHALSKGNPRYNRNFHGDGAHKELGFDPLTSDLRDAVAAIPLRRWMLAFCDFEGVDGWRTSMLDQELDYVRTSVWVKPDSAPQFSGDRPGSGAEAIVIAHPRGEKRWNGGGHRGVFTHNVNNFGKNERLHPSCKPLGLMRELVELFTDPGDLILDPFMGSGTTLVAAKELGRRAIGIELDPKHVATTIRRLKATAYKPRLLDVTPEQGVQEPLEALL